MRRLAAVIVPAAVVLVGCSSNTAVDQAPAPRPVKALAAEKCDEPTPTGKIDRLGYDLRFTRGAIRIKLRDGRAERCVQFAKWGNANIDVPPDSLLYYFSGGRGDGAQVEFRAVDLAGGKLPDTRPLGRLDHPINATVGVSINGVYYTSTTCELTLTVSNSRRAAGRFSCPQALAQTANPFDPSDDVSFDDPPASPPATAAALSGRFDVY
ncbi:MULTISPECIES: hypothetical protein [unclassified Gordonia (in: high G+C Gram-positive bacteria)]|uniref:hypothetical protein n=1 Tax=unclassified Gordonia (in: high G+C Gram-positive bacteria) TaxID=2657482 RepID=UPI001F05AA69|nr:hypothetical protein [Gordonia sp. PDNC005]